MRTRAVVHACALVILCSIENRVTAPAPPPVLHTAKANREAIPATPAPAARRPARTITRPSTSRQTLVTTALTVPRTTPVPARSAMRSGGWPPGGHRSQGVHAGEGNAGDA